MNLLPFIEFFFDFMMHEWLDGIYVALMAFSVLAALFGLFGRRRYMYV